MPHVQHIARAMWEKDALLAFVTTYAFREKDWSAALLNQLPSNRSRSLLTQLRRRAIDELPDQYVFCHPMWEMIRSAAQQAGASSPVVDALWDRASHSFDRIVARRYVSQADAIQAFEYTALASFQRAKERGIATILHIPSLDSAQFNEMRRRERERWNELTSESDAYFDRKFHRRYERRQSEIALADVIVANSSLTARSHIAAGANPEKVFVALLAAPPAIAEIEILSEGRQRPLNVLYAGSFSLGKGAHYLLDAWKRLNARTSATLNVYGRVDLPKRVLAAVAGEVVFHGSVPREALFRAYAAADVLVFPTLSDGFGLVVAEALAHGLPVITTDQAGAADLITAENGFVIPAADAIALTDALQWCLDNREKLREMRFKALETGRRRQWSDFRRDLVSVIDSGLRRKGRGCLINQPRYGRDAN